MLGFKTYVIYGTLKGEKKIFPHLFKAVIWLRQELGQSDTLNRYWFGFYGL